MGDVVKHTSRIYFSKTCFLVPNLSWSDLGSDVYFTFFFYLVPNFTGRPNSPIKLLVAVCDSSRQL